jgi:hypothetical protein
VRPPNLASPPKRSAANMVLPANNTIAINFVFILFAS